MSATLPPGGAHQVAAAGATRWLFAGTIFTSAFLLFLVQPLIAKQILPWFGGSAAVWSICMVFFQVVLLAGYAYADAVTRRLSLKAQARLQPVVEGGELLALRPSADAALDIGVPWDDAPLAPPSSAATTP